MAKRSNLVQSVIRALDILETIDAYGELGISEISDKLNLDKSTVHRIISTLRHKGYVVQNNTDHKYSNSIKLWEMGNNVVERLGVRRQAQPFMERLVIESCETV
ncbi:MAG: helix-turn-helix domain-containing protein, partial [Clostridiales bacterium]|nr:helix-turn-helix domain-containing protein [Clostridiales bacterium]